MFSINGRIAGSKPFASSTVNKRGKLAADSIGVGFNGGRKRRHNAECKVQKEKCKITDAQPF
jgi:hypothetical protein